tara:strand:- start:124 stop:540 length:417 start_codon:yes stop_codon:yes gene_type:complete
MSIGTIIAQAASGLAAPITGYLGKREETKQVTKTVDAKLAEVKLDSNTEITLSDKEWENISKRAETSSWKDEYVTVSVVSILNLIVLGGILTAFNQPQVLEGVTVALTTFNTIGVDIGGIMKVTIYAALGIYAFKKVL